MFAFKLYHRCSRWAVWEIYVHIYTLCLHDIATISIYVCIYIYIGRAVIVNMKSLYYLIILCQTVRTFLKFAINILQIALFWFNFNTKCSVSWKEISIEFYWKKRVIRKCCGIHVHDFLITSFIWKKGQF